MKKIDDFMQAIDKSVDKKLNPFFESIKGYFTSISSGILIVLLIVFFIKIIREKPLQLTSIILNDIDQIEKILNLIDVDCNILNFNAEVTPVDFLNVEKFSGSTVGCLNLAYPAKWVGPYMYRNPTLQGRFYEVRKTTDGFYIVPGVGVRLPNKMTLGKDFTITLHTNMNVLTKSNGPLNYRGEILTKKIKFKIGDWDNPLTKDKNKLENFNDALREFNEAYSFSCNSIKSSKA